MDSAESKLSGDGVEKMSVPAHISEYLQSQKPGRAILAALKMFLERDEDLLRVDANERSMTHRIAMYLQCELPEWNVDCEYNRAEFEPKRLGHLGLNPTAQDTEAQTVFPDIIAHIRRDPKRNYLVMEFKKSSREQGRDLDIRKLQEFRRQLAYQFALFVELHTGCNPGIAAVKWIE